MLAISSFFSYMTTIVSGTTLGEKRDYHFAKLAHECIVRQQMVFPSFYISLATATTLRNTQQTLLLPILLASSSLVFLLIGAQFVKLQDQCIAKHVQSFGGFGVEIRFRHWVRIFRVSFILALISLLFAVVMAGGSWALKA